MFCEFEIVREEVVREEWMIVVVYKDVEKKFNSVMVGE